MLATEQDRPDVAKARAFWRNDQPGITADRLAGLRVGGITAPCVIDGPMNGLIFRAYIEQFLAPTLKPDDIVVMDNLAGIVTLLALLPEIADFRVGLQQSPAT